MNLRTISKYLLKSKKAIVFVIILLVNIILLCKLLTLYFKPLHPFGMLKNTSSSFWPAYSKTNHSNDIELLTNIRLHQMQYTKNKENIPLVVSTLDVVPDTIETNQKTLCWKNKLTSALSSTGQSLEMMIDIVDFAELLGESNSVWSLFPATDLYHHVHKMLISAADVECKMELNGATNKFNYCSKRSEY